MKYPNGLAGEGRRMRRNRRRARERDGKEQKEDGKELSREEEAAECREIRLRF